MIFIENTISSKISKNFAGSNPAPAGNFQNENGLEKMLCLGKNFYEKYSSKLGLPQSHVSVAKATFLTPCHVFATFLKNATFVWFTFLTKIFMFLIKILVFSLIFCNILKWYMFILLIQLCFLVKKLLIKLIKKNFYYI